MMNHNHRMKPPVIVTDDVPPSEEEEAIYDDDLSPEEAAIAEFRAIKRKGWDSSASVDNNPESSNSRAGSVDPFTPLLERSLKKKSDSPDSRFSEDQYVITNSSQQVVYREGQPTATPILIYEDTRREVVQQCIANLMSTFHNHYPHSEVIADSLTGRFEDMLRYHYPSSM